MVLSKKFKQAILQVHLWLGLATGLIVFIVSITGCLYVFEKEIRDFTEQEYLYVPVQHKAFIGLATIIETYEKLAPKGKMGTIRITNDQPNATVSIGNKKKMYYFNPYTGALVKKTSADWLDTVEDLHRTLLLGDVGEFIMHWSVVIFVLMLISGWILWFPSQMRLLRQSLTIKWKASFKRVNYDLHNVLGFYASWILIIIAMSGLYFAFDGVKAAGAFLTGTKVSKPLRVKGDNAGPIVTGKTRAVRYDQFFSSFNQQYPGANTVTISQRKDGDMRLRMVYPARGIRQQNIFYFDPATARLKSYKLSKDYTTADKLDATNYDIHTGQFLGLFGKIMAFIAALISASLPVTGLIIWLKKKKKSRKKLSPVKA